MVGGEMKGGRRHGSYKGRSAGQSRAAVSGSAKALRTCQQGAGGRQDGRDDRVVRKGAQDLDESHSDSQTDGRDDEGGVDADGYVGGREPAAMERGDQEGSEDPGNSWSCRVRYELEAA